MATFRTFGLAYCPHFASTLTRDLSPALVFAEIMGIIKGSEASVHTLQPLTREQYLQISSRLPPYFAMEKVKSRLYEVFEAYEAMRTSRGAWDATDRVLSLLAEMKMNQVLKTVLGDAFDQLYVDGKDASHLRSRI